jgi:hypothetical protein
LSIAVSSANSLISRLSMMLWSLRGFAFAHAI